MRTFEYLLVGMAGIIGAAAACGGGNESTTTCVQGALNCLCRPNSNCDSGLQCSSNVCVAATNPGSGGQSSNTSAPSGNGGASDGNGGATAASTTTNANGGTQPASSTNATGGASTTSNSAATGGSQTCSNTTTDIKNCGACGHACKSGKCVGGKCVAGFDACFAKSSGFSNCTDYCKSVGGTCAAKACSESTYAAYILERDCVDQISVSRVESTPCSDPIVWPAGGMVRCCCSDST